MNTQSITVGVITNKKKLYYTMIFTIRECCQNLFIPFDREMGIPEIGVSNYIKTSMKLFCERLDWLAKIDDSI